MNLSGREQLCLEGEDPNLNQWEWAAETGLLVGARRTALWAPHEVLTEEEKREINPLTAYPGLVLLRAGPLPVTGSGLNQRLQLPAQQHKDR